MIDYLHGSQPKLLVTTRIKRQLESNEFKQKAYVEVES